MEYIVVVISTERWKRVFMVEADSKQEAERKYETQNQTMERLLDTEQEIVEVTVRYREKGGNMESKIKEITKAEYLRLKESYPSLTLDYVEEIVRKLLDGEEPTNVIDLSIKGDLEEFGKE
jgi:RecA/RadA recombinase